MTYVSPSYTWGMQQVELAKNKMAKAQAAMEGLAATRLDNFNNATQGVGVNEYVHPGFGGTVPSKRKVVNTVNMDLANKAKAAWADEERAMEQAKWVKEPEVVNMKPRSEPSYPTEAVSAQQGSWGYDKEATDKMHQQWLNNELPEGSIPTAVYNGPSEGLAAKFAGWFK